MSKLFVPAVIAVLSAGAMGLFFTTTGGKPATETMPTPAVSASVGGATPVLGPTTMRDLQVRTLDGTTEPLAPRTGGVVAVLSTTCSHCMRMLLELAAAQPEAGWPQLTLFSVQGAEPGLEKARSSGLRGMRVVGPTSPDQLRPLLDQLQVKGTPTLFHVDSTGQILHRLTGWVADEQATWQAWMGGR